MQHLGGVCALYLHHLCCLNVHHWLYKPMRACSVFAAMLHSLCRILKERFLHRMRLSRITKFYLPQLVLLAMLLMSESVGTPNCLVWTGFTDDDIRGWIKEGHALLGGNSNLSYFYQSYATRVICIEDDSSCEMHWGVLVHLHVPE